MPSRFQFHTYDGYSVWSFHFGNYNVSVNLGKYQFVFIYRMADLRKLYRLWGMPV